VCCGFQNEHEATISSRSHGNGCPVCGGKRLCANGCRSLHRERPDIANQWHHEKNKSSGFTPSSVSVFSNKKVWWECPKCCCVYEAIISNRTAKKGTNCPRCVESKGERYILDVLRDSDVAFQPQFCVRDEMSSLLKFDVFVASCGIIEYDGEGHFQNMYFDKQNTHALTKRQERDKTKNIYCLNRRTWLLRIHHGDKDRVPQIVSAFIFDGFASERVSLLRQAGVSVVFFNQYPGGAILYSQSYPHNLRMIPNPDALPDPRVINTMIDDVKSKRAVEWLMRKEAERLAQ
jgi:hypothetical protein